MKLTIRKSHLYPSRAISQCGRVFSNCTGKWVELKSYVANTGYPMVHAGDGKMVGATANQIGEHNHMCKLSDQDVQTIRQSYVRNGHPNQAELALQFHVSNGHISAIINGNYRRSYYV